MIHDPVTVRDLTRVTAGQKSGETSGANQYPFMTCRAFSKDTRGVIIVDVVPHY